METRFRKHIDLILNIQPFRVPEKAVGFSSGTTNSVKTNCLIVHRDLLFSLLEKAYYKVVINRSSLSDMRKYDLWFDDNLTGSYYYNDNFDENFIEFRTTYYFENKEDMVKFALNFADENK